MSDGERRAHYPVMLDVVGRLAVLVGGGPSVLRAARALSKCGADVVVITAEATDELLRMEMDGLLTVESRGYVRGDLDGAFMAVAASGSPEIDAAVQEEAQTRSVLLNVQSDGAASSFIVPSLVERGALQIAVSTGGIAPAAAREVRRGIAGAYGWEWGSYVEILGELRTLAMERTGLSDKELAPLFAAVADTDIRWRLRAGEKITAAELFEIHGATVVPAAAGSGTDS
jgi:precorrin-2 dehydrogenase/sirohydrochlorin ferrochelatase